MFEDYFKMPVIMVDGYREEKKAQKESEFDENEMDVVVGEAEIYWEDTVVSLVEMWYPDEIGFSNALKLKIFEATKVQFKSGMEFLVDWPKSKFKKEWSKFVEERAKVWKEKTDNIQIINLDLDNKEQMEKLINILNEGSEQGEKD